MLPQYITYEVGGTVSIEPTSRPTNAFVTVYDGAGGIVKENSNGTISTISTTLSNAHSKRVKTLYLNNASGIVYGDRLLISNPSEWVKTKSVSGNTVTIWSPLREDHASNSTVQSTKTTLTIASTNAASRFWDGRVRWELDNEIYYTAVECVKYPLKRIATEQDVLAVHPQFGSLLAAEEDIEAALDAAHEHVLGLISLRGRARCFTGSREFAEATALAFAKLHYRHQASETAKMMYDRYSAELGEEISRIESMVPRDDDGDGEIEADEKISHQSFRLVR